MANHHDRCHIYHCAKRVRNFQAPWYNRVELTCAVSSFGIFYGPCAGLLVADYWIIRQRRYKMDDIYRGDAESIYWYTYGVNWRAFVAFIVALAPVLPGYISKSSTLASPP